MFLKIFTIAALCILTINSLEENNENSITLIPDNIMLSLQSAYEALTQKYNMLKTEIKELKQQLREANKENLTRVKRQNPGGLPACEAALAESIANATSCRAELNSLNTTLQQCQTNLTNCNRDLTNCETNLQNCTTFASNCSAFLNNCSTTPGGGGGTGSGNCSTDLTDCREQLAECRGPCPNNFTNITLTHLATGIYYFSRIKLNWYAAREYCKSFGMDLLRLATFMEKESIIAELEDIGRKGSFVKTSYWTGLNNLIDSSIFKFVGFHGDKRTHMFNWTSMLSNVDQHTGHKFSGNCVALTSYFKITRFSMVPSECSSARQFICELPAHCL